MALGRVAGAQRVGQGVEPEGAFHWAVSGERAIDTVGHDCGVGLGTDDLSGSDEGSEHRVAGFESELEERAGDVLAFGLGGDVADNAEQVTPAGVLGKCLCEAFAIEDRDPIHDGIERKARDGDAYVAIRIEQDFEDQRA